MSAKNKSLLLTLEFPPDIGGIANYYHQIVKSDESIQVLHLKTSGCRLSWIRCFWPIARQTKKDKIDRLQIGQVLPLGYLGLIFKLMRLKRYLVYIHGLDVLSSKLSKWKKFWIKVILRQAQAIISNSNFVKEHASKKYDINAEKFRINYPKIDVNAIESEVKKLTPIERQNDIKIILSVGRLVPRKGFDKVIEALSQLLITNYPARLASPARFESRPARFASQSEAGGSESGRQCEAGRQLLITNWAYWIVGDGPDRGRLASLVKKYNLENRVKFLGQISTPQIYQYYKACNVFIMPAREIDGDVEGFGIVFLEAAAFGKPVIAGKSGGAPEAVVDGVTGLIVDPLNVDDISQALLKLLTDEELAAKLGQNGYERVKLEFS